MPLHVHMNSSFLQENIVINEPDFYEILYDFKNSLSLNNFINTYNQITLTESDLKCQIYHNLYELVNNNHCKLLTEIPDKKLRLDGDTIRTDMTIFLPQNIYYRNRAIQKGFTLDGKYIDIEIKFVRSGLVTEKKRNKIIDDFDKLSNIINRGFVPNHGETLYGLSIIGFQKFKTLRSFLNDPIFQAAMNAFTSQNKKIILLCCENIQYPNPTT